jgi:serine/threonine protein kinase
VRVESLIRPLDLATHWMESKSRAEMASSFDALVLSVNNIQVHYKKIKAEAHATPAPKPYNQHLQKSRKFPFVTSYIDGGQETSFRYVERLDEQKLLFSAFVNGDQQDGNCIVKFTQRYSEAAHFCLASYNSAPTLRHCIRISTTWTAVVMDRSRYTTLYGLCLTEDQQEKVRRKVGKTLQVLHDAGFVHGDLRDTNILIDLESLDSNDVRIHFVDFDWAGRIGETKYPDDINRITVRRPEGIEGGKLITMEHDKAMLTCLFT